MAKARKKLEDIELHEDAWPRFEQFVRDIAKAGPQRRTKADKPAPPRSKAKTTGKPDLEGGHGRKAK
jgi:hypothetical protein